MPVTFNKISFFALVLIFLTLILYQVTINYRAHGVELDIFFLLLCAMSIRYYRKIRNNFSISDVLIIIIIFSSSIVSPNIASSLVQFKVYLSIILFGYCLYYLIGDYIESAILPIMLAFIASFFVVAFDVINYVQHLSYTTYGEWRRHIPHFLNIRHFGYYCFISATAATVIFLSVKKFKSIISIAVIICLFSMIYTGSRGALLGWVSFVFLSGVSVFPLKKCFIYWMFCLILLSISFLLSWSAPSNVLFTDFVLRLLPNMHLEGIDITMNSISSGRLGIWRQVTRESFSSPILGLGPDGYRFIPNKIISFSIQPHSSLFQLLIEFGWVGGSTIFFCGWNFYQKFYKNIIYFHQPLNERTYLRLIFLAYINSFLIFSLVDGLFYYTFTLLHFSIIVIVARSLYFCTEREANFNGVRYCLKNQPFFF